MTHFTDQELQRWSEHGAADESERAVQHMSDCPSCATRFALAVRIRPATEASQEDVGDFIRAGRQTSARPYAIARNVLALAAAAIIVVGIVVQIAVRQRQAVPDEPRFRGSAIQTLSPSGAVGADASFAWASGVRGSRYRIDVGEADAPIYSTEASAPPVAFSADLVAKLTRGRTYWWTVTSLDA